MNLPIPTGPHGAPQHPSATSATATGAPLPGHWLQVIDEMGSEVGMTLSGALERVNLLASTGKIDRRSLKRLREEIARARRIGMVGQQLSRIASGNLNQAAEEVNLTRTLRELIQQHGRDAQARSLLLRQAMGPASVMADATLLHALLQAVMDWALEHAQTEIEFRIERLPWPPNACLRCHFPLREQAAPTGLSWRLVEQIAWALELRIERMDTATTCALMLEFPRTLAEAETEEAVEAELQSGFGLSQDSKPLAGSHVLVLAVRRDVRADIREAVRHMGLVVDFVSSVDEAERFCQEALPDGIIVESALAGERFARLCQSARSDLPTFASIEIAEEGDHCDLSQPATEAGMPAKPAQLGRHAVLSALPSALIFELTRHA